MKSILQSCSRFFTGCLFLSLLFFSFAPHAPAEETSPLFTQAQRSADRDGYTLITTKGLGRLLEEQPGVLLVDVRFAYEYAQARLPGSISLPVDLRDRGDLSPERRQAFLEALGPDKERTIVIFCRDFR